MSQISALHGNVRWQSSSTTASLHPRIPLEIVHACPVNPPEHTTRLCAEALAARLTAYWHGRGFAAAKFWCVAHRVLAEDGEGAEHATRYQRWDIRSNLINGIPPETESR
jgi:hypothetical protein